MTEDKEYVYQEDVIELLIDLKDAAVIVAAGLGVTLLALIAAGFFFGA